MADPPSTTPFEVAASQEDALLATKLHVPGPQPGLVARPRLLVKLPRVRGHLNAYERRARDGSSRATYPSAVPAGVPG